LPKPAYPTVFEAGNVDFKQLSNVLSGVIRGVRMRRRSSTLVTGSSRGLKQQRCPFELP